MPKKIKKSKSQERREAAMMGVDLASGKDKSVIISRSPAPVRKIETFNFYDGLKLVSNGKKITKISWGDHNIYVFMKNDFLHIHIGGTDRQLIVSKGDMEGIDWFELPEKN